MDKFYQNLSGTRPKKGFMSANTGPKHFKKWRILKKIDSEIVFG
jgi:hypothetical protein